MNTTTEPVRINRLPNRIKSAMHTVDVEIELWKTKKQNTEIHLARLTEQYEAPYNPTITAKIERAKKEIAELNTRIDNLHHVIGILLEAAR